MKPLAIFFLPLFLMGCFGREQPVVVDRPVPQFQTPTPAEQRGFTWIVITRDNINEVLAQLEASGQEPVLFAVTPEGYQAIILNAGELRRFIVQQQSVIDAQQEYLIGIQ